MFNLATNQFLLVRSSDPSCRLWSIPRGDIEKHENHASLTAVREFKEETSIDLLSAKIFSSYLLGTVSYGAKLIRYLTAYLFIINEPINPSVILDWENDKYTWSSFRRSKKLLYVTQHGLIEKTKQIIHFTKKLKKEVDNPVKP